MRKFFVTILILTFAFCNTVTVYATESTPHVYGAKLTAAKGETINYPIYIEDNTGIAAIKVIFASETKDIAPVMKDDGKSLDFEMGEALKSGSAFGSADETGGQIVWFDVKNNRENGKLFIIKLKVSEDAQSGDYTIKLSYSPENTITQKEAPVTFRTTDGTITVKGSTSSGGSSGSSIVVPDKTDMDNQDKEKDESVDAVEPTSTDIKAAVKKIKLKLSSKLVKAKGKTAIKLTWKIGNSETKFDGYEIRRSLQKSKGYGTKSFAQTKKTQYTNTKALKKGKTYYYKVRGYKLIDGKKVYTEWSNKAYRTVKQ